MPGSPVTARGCMPSLTDLAGTSPPVVASFLRQMRLADGNCPPTPCSGHVYERCPNVLHLKQRGRMRQAAARCVGEKQLKHRPLKSTGTGRRGGLAARIRSFLQRRLSTCCQPCSSAPRGAGAGRGWDLRMMRGCTSVLTWLTAGGVGGALLEATTSRKESLMGTHQRTTGGGSGAPITPALLL